MNSKTDIPANFIFCYIKQILRRPTILQDISMETFSFRSDIFLIILIMVENFGTSHGFTPCDFPIDLGFHPL